MCGCGGGCQYPQRCAASSWTTEWNRGVTRAPKTAKWCIAVAIPQVHATILAAGSNDLLCAAQALQSVAGCSIAHCNFRWEHYCKGVMATGFRRATGRARVRLSKCCRLIHSAGRCIPHTYCAIVAGCNHLRIICTEYHCCWTVRVPMHRAEQRARSVVPDAHHSVPASGRYTVSR